MAKSNVVPLFPQHVVERSCWNCTLGAWTEAGVFCQEFGVQIIHEEKAAEDCPAFEERGTVG